MEQNQLMIQARQLTKLYKLYRKPSDRLKESLLGNHQYSQDFYALHDVSFDIYKGETVGILGKNGAGKSTLLKVVTEVLTPTSGDLIINGKVSALLELGAGFNPEYNGIENIYLNCSMMGMKREQVNTKIDSIIQFADIGDFIYQPVKSYSSGMFARLAFSVAISVEPEILIVDEALSVGDTRFQIKCMDYMKKMMEGGTTVLFVSHDINAVRRFCQRAIWLHQGRIILDGEVNRVADCYADFLKRDVIDLESAPMQSVETASPIVSIEKTSMSSISTSSNISESSSSAKRCPISMNQNSIAQLTSFEVTSNGQLVGEEILYDAPLDIEVTYWVVDDTIPDPVLGIAVRNADDDYTCGLNTLLDQVKIPWKKGENRMLLHYPLGIRAAGGKYYFEIALEDQTATVGLHYIQRIKKFTMVMKYMSEGRYNIPHYWEVPND